MDQSKNVVDQLSSALNRRDQGPNEAIATAIAKGKDFALLEEVKAVLESKANTRPKNDAVLVLTALSRLQPEMLIEQVGLLVALTKSKSNRQVFGSMIALGNTAPFVRDQLLPHLPEILKAMDEGTVVTRDYGFTILTELYKEDLSGDLCLLINEQILKAPSNQLGQYTEKFMKVVRKEDNTSLINALEIRSGELTHENHRKRLMKNLKKIREVS